MSDDNWIPWHGGECPIKSADTRYEVRMRNDARVTVKQNGGPFYWGHRLTSADIIAYRITENHEPPETEMTGKTLAELNVKPGDVVQYIPLGGVSTITHIKKGKYYGDGSHRNHPYSDDPDYKVVSRATPTRADLIAERDAKAAELAALNAQIDAMPETVRVYARLNDNDQWCFSRFPWVGLENHVREWPLINGVPEGFTKVEDRT